MNKYIQDPQDASVVIDNAPAPQKIDVNALMQKKQSLQFVIDQMNKDILSKTAEIDSIQAILDGIYKDVPEIQVAQNAMVAEANI